MRSRIDFSLYIITTEIPILKRNHLDVAEAALSAGATMIQLRDKSKSTEEMLDIASSLRELTRQAGITLIVNDRADVALDVGADGVHLGQNDLPLSYVRRFCTSEMIIGISVKTLDQAIKAAKEGADYLGVGPIFSTPSKDDAGEPIGCEIIAQIRDRVKLPLVAIGGITKDNLEEVFKAGADGIAVISAVACAEDMEEATAELLKRIQDVKCRCQAQVKRREESRDGFIN